jgi:ribosomal protein RSM22 (predicted rRNA methylase)
MSDLKNFIFKEPEIGLSKLADHVLQLSDFYIENQDAETPWDKEFCYQAYLHYFLPLNFLRNDLVIRRGLEVDFFSDLENSVDWGSGPGTSTLALNAHLQLKKNFLVDKSKRNLSRFSSLWNNFKNLEFTEHIKEITFNPRKSILVCSYSLTEKNNLPFSWDQFEALMILEPSTSVDGRRLAELREQLIQKGFSIWAPCLHHQKCPLLTHSKKDWCHDRVKVDAPDWFLELEKKLPMRNNTITTSYLLARKKKPTLARPARRVRLIGDQLQENGKTRQLICRGENREYLAWLHKNSNPPELFRGDFFDLPDSESDYDLISNEIRIKK